MFNKKKKVTQPQEPQLYAWAATLRPRDKPFDPLNGIWVYTVAISASDAVYNIEEAYPEWIIREITIRGKAVV